MKALNQPASVVLRTNTIKIKRSSLQRALAEEGFETRKLPEYPEALELIERANVFKSLAFKQGFFEVQDASSQKVAPFLQVRPGMRVIDACAGAGGKSLHISSLMENKGQIIALDIFSNKLIELRRRARRNGVHNIETRTIDSTKIIKKLYGKGDRVLIDAPCSGTGVFRRNPDAKWKLSEEFLNEVILKQQELLVQYTKMVKPGGKMVYATCSILPQENRQQVEAFLDSEEGKDFELEEEQYLWASKTGFDGFYMARLRRSN